VNDVEHGGCKYGIISLSGLGKESLTVEMYDNLYFTNRKVRCSVPASFGCCILRTMFWGGTGGNAQGLRKGLGGEKGRI